MTGYAIALRKHSKYKEMIDRKILEYIYSGELERTANFWFSGSCKNNKEDANNESLGVPQVISIFFLLTMGIIIGLIILVVHQLYDKHLMDKIMKIFNHKNKQKERVSSFWTLYESNVKFGLCNILINKSNFKY